MCVSPDTDGWEKDFSWCEWGNNLLVSEWEAVGREWKSIKWCFKEKINEFDEMPVIYKRDKTLKDAIIYYLCLFIFLLFSGFSEP